ncbi:MAG: SAM-dependent methyltransferase [Bdellovibrionota bacterium]
MTQTEFATTAKKYWTPERTAKVIGTKKYPITPLSAPHLLRMLGILNADSSISPNNMHKFIQINHMFTLIEPHISELRERHKLLNILDAGCGKSYLTFLLAWFFNGSDSCKIFGVDSNKKLIQDCQSKAKTLGFEEFLNFEAQSLLSLEWTQESRAHCVISLHACDTATDMALAFAIKQKSDFIAVAPCCQAELARKWKEAPSSQHALNPVFHTPQLRREVAAQMTDALRVCLMRANGYEVTCTEFVDSAHTPKNRLITCIRRGNYLKSAQTEYEELKSYLGGHSIMLEDLLKTSCV